MGQQETEQLNQILAGAALSRAVCTVAELGVADHITAGSPQPASHLAAATQTHERSLYRLLRFLASHGIFQEAAGGFDHTPLSAALRSDAPDSFRGGAIMFHHMFAGWDGLDHAVRTGKPGFDKVFGQSVFPWVAGTPGMGAIFDAGMTCFHGHETEAMLNAYDFRGTKLLADVGGGNGSLISGVLNRYPHMRGILFDLGHVVARAKANLENAGLTDRCQVIEGNFFESFPQGADTYIMRHIIHDWTDEQCVQILGHCRNVIPAAGKLLVVECVVPTGNARSMAKDYDMTMMNFPGGIERTEAEFRDLFRQSGFEVTAVVPTESMAYVVEGKPV